MCEYLPFCHYHRWICVRGFDTSDHTLKDGEENVMFFSCVNDQHTHYGNTIIDLTIPVINVFPVSDKIFVLGYKNCSKAVTVRHFLPWFDFRFLLSFLIYHEFDDFRNLSLSNEGTLSCLALKKVIPSRGCRLKHKKTDSLNVIWRTKGARKTFGWQPFL